METELSDEGVVALVCPTLYAQISHTADSQSWEGSALARCVSRLARFARCSRSAFIVALVLLRRLKAVTPSCIENSERDVQRLYVGALLLAAKTLDDRCFSNTHFARISGALTAAELSQLEMRILVSLSFRTFVQPEEYCAVEYQIYQHSVPTEIVPCVANHDGQAYTVHDTQDERFRVVHSKIAEGLQTRVQKRPRPEFGMNFVYVCDVDGNQCTRHGVKCEDHAVATQAEEGTRREEGATRSRDVGDNLRHRTIRTENVGTWVAVQH